jgi:hypothetical protein
LRSGLFLSLIEKQRAFCVFFDQLILDCFSLSKLRLLVGCVCKRRQKSTVVCERLGEHNLPLAGKVCFKTRLQQGNRLQVPKLVRWQFKMDNQQVLKINVSALSVWRSNQTFYGKMGKDGRITVPKLQLELMQGSRETSLVGYVIEVTLEAV